VVPTVATAQLTTYGTGVQLWSSSAQRNNANHSKLVWSLTYSTWTSSRYSYCTVPVAQNFKTTKIQLRSKNYWRPEYCTVATSTGIPYILQTFFFQRLLLNLYLYSYSSVLLVPQRGTVQLQVLVPDGYPLYANYWTLRNKVLYSTVWWSYKCYKEMPGTCTARSTGTVVFKLSGITKKLCYSTVLCTRSTGESTVPGTSFPLLYQVRTIFIYCYYCTVRKMSCRIYVFQCKIFRTVLLSSGIFCHAPVRYRYGGTVAGRIRSSTSWKYSIRYELLYSTPYCTLVGCMCHYRTLLSRL
jgi:hypothetical protein